MSDKLPDCQYEYGYEEPKATIISICNNCDGNINKGDEYYEIDGQSICVTCMEECKCTAGIE